MRALPNIMGMGMGLGMSNHPRSLPKLSLSFLSEATLDPRIDFSRTSGGGYFGSDGLYRWTPASRNLLTYTQEFDNAIWNKGGGSVTVSANAAVAPDGTLTADAIVESAAAGAHNIYQTATVVSGQAYTWSGFVKANGRSIVRLTCQATTTIYTVEFDLSTLTATTRSGTGTATIMDAGGGWYRITATATSTAAGTGYWRLNLCDATNSASYTGDGMKGVYLWGAQLEMNSSATTYQKAADGLYPPRLNYDPVTKQPRGLLIEEARTNLATYSEQLDNGTWTMLETTVSVDQTVSPDGLTSADLLVSNANSNRHTAMNIQGGAPASGTYSMSVFLKKGTQRYIVFGDSGDSVWRLVTVDTNTFTIVDSFSVTSSSITDYGNGWYRVAITATRTTAGNYQLFVGFSSVSTNSYPPSYAGTTGDTFYAWGAQIEVGAFPTSYIATTSSQVTRSADTCSIQGANFASFYNASEGTFVVEFDSSSVVSSAVKAIAVVSDGTSNNRSYAYVRADGVPNLYVANASAVQADMGNSAISNGAVTRVAFAYKTNDFALVTNGGAIATDALGVPPPTVNRMEIGNFLGGAQINGHIRKIAYYPTRLSNAQLQALTA